MGIRKTESYERSFKSGKCVYIKKKMNKHFYII